MDDHEAVCTGVASPTHAHRNHSRLLPAWLLAMCMFATQAAEAQEDAEAPWLPIHVSANPNEALFALEYVRATRGRLGDAFGIVGDPQRGGYDLVFAPLIELHEPQTSTNVLPSQYWRARVSLEQGFTFSQQNLRTRIALLLQHESDHETAHAYSMPGFLTLNDIGLRASIHGHSEHFAWMAGGDALLYVLSCTEPSRSRCENFRGSTSLGGQAQLAVAWTSARLWNFVPFASTFAAGILAHGLLQSEFRWLTHIGFYANLNASTLSLFLSGWLGRDVGVERHRNLNAVGIGASFSR